MLYIALKINVICSFFTVHGVYLFTLPFSELSLVELALDQVD